MICPPSITNLSDPLECFVRTETLWIVRNSAIDPLKDWELLLGEISQGWSKQDDLRVVQGFLKSLPGAREELGERLSCVSAYIRMRNIRLARPLESSALEDLSQDCHISILQVADTYTGESPLAAWAQGFVRFAFLKYFRAQQGEQATLKVLRRDFVEPETRDPDPLETSAVTSALNTLTDIERRTLSMRILEELPFPDIAAALHEPVTTTKSRYVRLVVRLGPQLQAFWKDGYNEGNE